MSRIYSTVKTLIAYISGEKDREMKGVFPHLILYQTTKF